MPWSSAYGIRTRVTDVRGQRPKPLDERARIRLKTKEKRQKTKTSIVYDL